MASAVVSLATDATEATEPTEYECPRPQKPRGISADKKQFQHAAGGVYIEEEQLIQFRRFIERYEAGEIDYIDE